jgi:uncharacterized membrane protein
MGGNRYLGCLAGLPCFRRRGSVPLAAPLLIAAAMTTNAAAGPQSSVITEGQPLSADAGTPEFVLRVCNGTPRTVWVSLASRRRDSTDGWFVAGWWKVGAHGCEELGSFPRPTVYLHAENAEGRQWSGTGARLCVQLQNFRYAYRRGHACDGVLRGFYEKAIDRSWGSFEWRVAQ